MPEDGQPKAPNTPDNPRVGGRLKAAGAAAGVDFTGKTDRSPNAIKAHTLAKYFEGESQQDSLMNVMFRHYFTDGKYPDSANLREAAVEVGVTGTELDEAIAFMEDNQNQKAVRSEASNYSANGISGVPYFFFNEQPAFSGAQPAAMLKKMILQVADAKS